MKIVAWQNPLDGAQPLILSHQKQYMLPSASAGYSIPLYAAVDVEAVKRAVWSAIDPSHEGVARECAEAAMKAIDAALLYEDGT